MNKLRLAFAVLLGLAVLPLGAQAQTGGTITGQVTDQATQQPLPGVQVFVAGTQRGALTNQQGRFSLGGVPAGQHVVRASIVGYAEASRSVTVGAGQTVTANFALRTSAIELSGLVVNAITGQAERRREMGTNVANIAAADIIERAPITRTTDVLTARTAGVQVASLAGTTGTSTRVRIRGANSLSLSNEPLIFVDGVQFSNASSADLSLYGLQAGGAGSSRLNDINPADIESMEVLKGPAATSQYGTAAANGVILITTKRGRPDRTRWNAYTEYGTLNDENDYPANYFSYQLNTPGAVVFRDNGTVNAGTLASAARQRCFNFQAAAGECRQDSTAVFNTLMDPRTRPFTEGFRRKHGLSVSGGTERVTYYVSGDLEDEQGVIEWNTLDRVNLRTNLSADVTEKLNLQVNAGYLDSNLRINSNDNSVFSPLINGYLGRAIFNPDTTPAKFNRNFRAFRNDAIREYSPTEEINRLTIGSSGRYEAAPWLMLTANGGLDWTNRAYELTLQPGREIGAIAPGFYGIGFRDAERSNNYLWTVNSAATASFNPMSALSSETTVGASFQRELWQTLFSEGAGIVEGTEDVGSATEQFFMNEGFREIRTVGGFVQQRFGYDDRLFLTLGLRGDDNSAFGADFGFVTYPNANLSWVVTEESWFPQTNLLTSLRLRTGYGTSGLRPNFRQAVTLYAPAGVQVNGSDAPGVILNTTGNTLLEPERTTEYEAGLDAGLFGDRLSAELTYYRKRSDDALIQVPLPPSYGLTNTRIDNLASVQNSGFELNLNALVLDRDNVKLNLRLASTTTDNEIRSLGGESDLVINRGEQRHRQGFPAGAFFQDRYKYDDVNKDGLLARSEISIVRDTVNGEVVPHYIGPSLPTFSNSLSGELTLFNFVTVSTLFDQRGGHYQLDGSSEFRCRAAASYVDRGCNDNMNPNASLEEQARYIGTALLGTRYGYIHKADFIKWREVAVTLNVPERFQRGALMRGASLTLSGRNLATWTDYPGMDPEIAEAGTGNFNQNEFNTQPPVRYWTARLNFTF